MLAKAASTASALGMGRVQPSEDFKAKAMAISSTPAASTSAHAARLDMGRLCCLLQSATHRLALAEPLQPGLHVRVVTDADAQLFKGHQPWVEGDIGHRVGVPRDMARLGQPD